ncbi:MAG: methionine adenosyltransferase [Patescibacteria group bacterium]|nr:methionine adenosyltransferase [Patescibacteria group bacterium]
MAIIHIINVYERSPMNYQYFTSESVAAGHPDKVCDQISDAVLDAAIKAFPKSRVAVETLVTINQICMAGEVTCPEKLDFENIARKVIKRLGYTNPILNFTNESPVNVYIHQQSPDIAMGANVDGAGDQGMMFGYACNETKELMPLPIILSHRLVEKMDELRENGKVPCLRPDGKSEVKVRYESGKPVAVEKVVLAVPHDQCVTKEDLQKILYKEVIVPVLEPYGFSVTEDNCILNGTGKWEIGGPATDTGVTGRKIVVDSYGGMARIGGGAFSGKDVTKVDRSGAYGARYVAKNIVANGLADRCEVQVAYVIGIAKPLTVAIETFGTEKKELKLIEDFAGKILDLSVRGIIEGLNLRQPIYEKTAAYGHFGREEFPWEKVVKM